MRRLPFTNFRQLESKMGYLRRSTFAIAAAAAAICLAAPAHAQKTLRAVMHSDLKILDPIWTTAYIVAQPRLHGLRHAVRASTRSSRSSRRWSTSTRSRADKLTWTFTLRDGLEWHDGQPVTAEDCIASIKRWGARDAMGQKLMAFVDGLRGRRTPRPSR